jgi:hypothetical protein
MHRLLTALAVVGAIALATVSPAAAATSGASDNDIAGALLSTSVPADILGPVRAGSRVPAGEPNGVGDTPIGVFPTNGSTFAVLTTGNVDVAGLDNTSGSTGSDDRGPNVRGTTDVDVSILKIPFTTPGRANCLAFDFQFLSEEYPEYVDTQYNDAFIAELDHSTWTTNSGGSGDATSTIHAPDNFAYDPSGAVISINAAGVTSMTAGLAAGTTYDGATPLLTASHAVTPGAHTLILSIFDQGDALYDSAAFLDNLRFTNVPSCQPGADKVNETVSGTLAAGASLTTDTEGDGATPSDPLETTITLPDGGEVTIAESNSTLIAPPAFSFLDLQAQVTAPPTTGDPAVATFRIDASELSGGFDPAGLTIFRNGFVVADCDPAPPPEAPVPASCVSSRTLLDDGDVQASVRTTTFSTFDFAVAHVGEPTPTPSASN